MARYVLLEFDDNDKAKAFVERVNGEYRAIDMPERGIRARAVWGKPTKFCECTKGERGANPFTRGAKSGWWVHAQCGRPTRMWAQGNHWFSAIGRNLLPGNTDYTPAGWGYPDKVHGDKTGHIVPVGPDDGYVPTGEGEARAARRAARKARRERPRRV